MSRFNLAHAIFFVLYVNYDVSESFNLSLSLIFAPVFLRLADVALVT